jgi:hypothetical protein
MPLNSFRGFMPTAATYRGDHHILRDSETGDARVYLTEAEAQREVDALESSTDGGYFVMPIRVLPESMTVSAVTRVIDCPISKITITKDEVSVTFTETE